jgi:hypothetical protein
MMLLTTLIGVEAVTVGVFWGLGTTMDAVGLMNRFNWFAVALLLGTLVAGFVLYLWVNGCFAFAAPACAFEDSRSFRAMGRSWGLSREGRWRVAGTLFLLLVFLLGLTVGTQRLVRIIFATIWDWTTHHAHLMAMRNGADYVVRAILSAVVSPLYPIAVTLIYYDQRIRKEGFDIEGLMQSAGMVEAVAAAADAAAGGETDA